MNEELNDNTFVHYDADGMPAGVANVSELYSQARALAAKIVQYAGEEGDTITELIESELRGIPESIQVAQLSSAVSFISMALGMELSEAEEASGNRDMRRSYMKAIIGDSASTDMQG